VHAFGSEIRIVAEFGNAEQIELDFLSDAEMTLASRNRRNP